MSHSDTSITGSRERSRAVANGWIMLAVNLTLLIAGIALLIRSLNQHSSSFFWTGIVLQALGLILLCGHFALQPNEARVLILAGAYHGTVRKSGFFWAN